jgi:predicted lipid-binding transport protein (Tim44 family)
VHIDILIFALIAGFLIYRLNSVLGTRHGGERPRQNPFAAGEAKVKAQILPVTPVPTSRVSEPLAGLEQAMDAKANEGGKIETGLAEIAAVDAQFEVASFMQGARQAFEMIVKAYSRGDLGALKPLLSPKLYEDFASGVRAREAAGHTSSIDIHRIRAARIIEAHLGGVMAYITVDYDVEETVVTRDRSGAVVAGNPDRVFSVEDIWTFTRDTRSSDPNWILIETRAAEK